MFWKAREPLCRLLMDMTIMGDFKESMDMTRIILHDHFKCKRIHKITDLPEADSFYQKNSFIIIFLEHAH